MHETQVYQAAFRVPGVTQKRGHQRPNSVVGGRRRPGCPGVSTCPQNAARAEASTHQQNAASVCSRPQNAAARIRTRLQNAVRAEATGVPPGVASASPSAAPPAGLGSLAAVESAAPCAMAAGVESAVPPTEPYEGAGPLLPGAARAKAARVPAGVKSATPSAAEPASIAFLAAVESAAPRPSLPASAEVAAARPTLVSRGLGVPQSLQVPLRDETMASQTGHLQAGPTSSFGAPK
mmetsp:Transcript_118946/g.331845  ORF Transcript_118946/g.331845 Transcript_118946/m.331845 type:complete len:236 (+) Transcript_118946:23-730(+)